MPPSAQFSTLFWFGPKLVTLEFYTNHRIRHLYYLVRVFSGPFLLVLAFSWLILYVGSVSNHTKTVLGLIFSQFFQIEKNIPAKNSLTFHGWCCKWVGITAIGPFLLVLLFLSVFESKFSSFFISFFLSECVMKPVFLWVRRVCGPWPIGARFWGDG